MMEQPSPLVLYASRYGSTREYAEALARELRCPAADVAAPPPAGWERSAFLVLGSPIYGASVLPAMEEFCREQQERLTGVPLAAFVVCGDTVWIPRAGEGGHANLEKLTRLLPRAPFASAVLPGRMRMDQLDERDGPAILAFYRRLGKEAAGFDRMAPGELAAFAGEVRRKAGG
jgi:menaquinone-dependent protoporphyrinogen IX oxidase